METNIEKKQNIWSSVYYGEKIHLFSIGHKGPQKPQRIFNFNFWVGFVTHSLHQGVFSSR
jgi:hypothetical protein